MSHFDNFSQPITYGLPSGDGARSSRSNYGGSERHDERASLSGSEDGSYAVYPDSSKNDADIEEEGNAALTSQTLNADGTPKRPMNAFMIFARRRRPQVSAENQSMRTGEISKILSKEWTSMPSSEKLFYQEQAKQLKESFNTRYPDYVYRRRPNNSRRRKRSDSNLRGVDNEMGDDGMGGGDLENSPTDGEDLHFESGSDSSYSRTHHDAHGFSDHQKYSPHVSRTSTHPYSSSDSPYRTNGVHESRLPYMASSATDRLSHNLGTPVSARIPQSNHSSLSYPAYLSPPGQSSSVYGGDIDTHDSWQTRVERGPSAWPGSTHDRASSSIGTGNSKASHFPGSSGSWQGLASPTGSIPSSQHSNPNYSFPTLTAPFYPNQSSASGFQSNAAISPTSHPTSSHYDPTHLHSLPADREFETRIPSINSASPYASNSSRDSLPYPQRSHSRGLPPVHSLSGYPTATTSGPGHSGTSQGYWSRE